MNETDEHCLLRLRARTDVWGGFYKQSATERILAKQAAQDNVAVDSDWVKATVAEEWHSELSEEQNWPPITDCEKLSSAFEICRDFDIIGLKSASAYQSHALGVVAEWYDYLGGESSNIRGYCFYAEWDVDQAVNWDGLMISYGHISGGEEGIDIGCILLETLHDQGLDIVWEADLESRLVLENIRWLRRAADAVENYP